MLFILKICKIAYFSLTCGLYSPTYLTIVKKILSISTFAVYIAATDVTVNGVKQRVSAVTYDDLGRIASVTRGAASNSGGKVSYKYNLHGQTTEIKGPGLTQNLHYADGPGKTLYNGSISAMTTTEYRGNVIYRDGKADIILFSGV